MIKVIAFDLVGVLVNERDIVLSNEEEKLERLFGPNLSDGDYFKKAKEIVCNEENNFCNRELVKNFKCQTNIGTFRD